MHVISRVAVALLGLSPAVQGVKLLASHFAGGVYTLDFSGNKLTQTGKADGCGRVPGWIQYYSDDKTLYCFDESWYGSGNLVSYNVSSDGTLKQFALAPTTGNSVHGLLYGGSNGKGFVATAEYSPSTITTYKLPLSSNSKPLQTEKFTLAQKGPNSRQDVAHPHQTLLDPTGKFILVPDLGADLIRVFSINASSGKLTACGSGKTNPGDGPRHGVFYTTTSGYAKSTPDMLYVVNELGNSVGAWSVSYTGSCISLKLQQTLSTYKAGTKGGPTTKAAEVRVAGDFLYVSNRADQTFGTQQDSIAIYTIDPATGKIAWMDAANSKAYYPRTFQMNKAGDMVAVGGQTSSSVVILPRDKGTGKLGSPLASIVISPVGRAGEEDGLSAVVWVE